MLVVKVPAAWQGFSLYTRAMSVRPWYLMAAAAAAASKPFAAVTPNTFRADKNIKLATYASRCIENEILMYLRKNAAQRTEVSFDEPLSTDWDGKELLLSDVLGTDGDTVMRPIEADVDRKLLRDAVGKLSSREQDIITLRFGLGGKKEMTQKEVADRMGISQSYISRLEKRIILRLKREILKMS